MSSPVVCCPVAVKLKPEELRVAKRLSHCCGKNLHDWCPQASRAESVSIQDCVIFSTISLFQPTWSTSLRTYRVGIYSTVGSEKGKDWLPEVWFQGLTPETKLGRRQTVRTRIVDSSRSSQEKDLEGGVPKQWEK